MRLKISTIMAMEYPMIETIFVQDKWAEWCEKQSSLILPNIESRKLVTHVVDNIDWENKSLIGDQTHHSNSS